MIWVSGRSFVMIRNRTERIENLVMSISFVTFTEFYMVGLIDLFSLLLIALIGF